MVRVLAFQCLVDPTESMESLPISILLKIELVSPFCSDRFLLLCCSFLLKGTGWDEAWTGESDQFVHDYAVTIGMSHMIPIRIIVSLI